MAGKGFICRNGRLFDKASGAELPPARGRIARPMIFSDLPDYRSPVTGKTISGRAARREDLARHGCIPWEPGMVKGEPTEFKSEAFARKHGAIS